MPVLHQMQISGNCYKVLTARQTGCELVLRDYPLLGGETRKPAFLAKNANGRVPLLEWEDSQTLPQSPNAIIWHLAEGSSLAPDSAWSRAEALSWMFFEQYSHEPYIAVARYWLAYAPKDQVETKRHLVAEWHAKGNQALAVMNGHLKRHDWFAGKRYSVADIALYGYTHCADEGGFDLSAFPCVLTWLARVREQPGHVPLSAR